MPEQTALFILGMHRSGTSALTRVVNLLGADLSDNLMPPQPDNERGFWEQDEIVPAHEALLLSLRASWCDPFLLPDNIEKTDMAAHHATRLEAITKERFSHSSLWALKDPRLSILLPVWKPILKRLEVNPVYLIALRHPLEVAKSLEKRDAMPLEHGCALWLHYTLRSLQFTEGETCKIVSYNSLLDNWRVVAANIASTMKREWPKPIDDAARDIDAFLSRDLRHHNAPGVPEDAGYFTKTAAALYDALMPFDGKAPACHDMIEKALRDFRAHSDSLRYSSSHANHLREIAVSKLAACEQKIHDLTHAANLLDEEVGTLKKALEVQEQKIREDAAEFALMQNKLNRLRDVALGMESSLSWRITAPLRRFKQLISKK